MSFFAEIFMDFTTESFTFGLWKIFMRKSIHKWTESSFIEYSFFPFQEFFQKLSKFRKNIIQQKKILDLYPCIGILIVKIQKWHKLWHNTIFRVIFLPKLLAQILLSRAKLTTLSLGRIIQKKTHRCRTRRINADTPKKQKNAVNFDACRY